MHIKIDDDGASHFSTHGHAISLFVVVTVISRVSVSNRAKVK